jgi:choline transport protein
MQTNRLLKNWLIDDSMPIYELWRQATGSEAAATVFVVVLHIITLFAVAAVQQTASRMTWAFARDGALPARSWLSGIHSKQQVPIWSLIANAIVIFISGCIYLGSTAAFTAIIGSSLILQILSFTIPAALLLWQKRSEAVLPLDRPFRVPEAIGWVANSLVVVFGILFSVFFTFPAAIPVSGVTMSMLPASEHFRCFANRDRLCLRSHCSGWNSGDLELDVLCQTPLRRAKDFLKS